MRAQSDVCEHTCKEKRTVLQRECYVQWHLLNAVEIRENNDAFENGMDFNKLTVSYFDKSDVITAVFFDFIVWMFVLLVEFLNDKENQNDEERTVKH